MFHTITATDCRTGWVRRTQTDDYESALRIYDRAVQLAKMRGLCVKISMYLSDGTLHLSTTVNAEVVQA